MTVDTRPRPDDGTNVPAQIVGVLLAPSALLLGLQLAYQYVPQDCRARSSALGHVIHAGSLILCLLGAWIAWSVWSRYGAVWPDDEGPPVGRSILLGAIGVLISLLSALVAVSQWMPTFFLSPCW